MTINWTVVLTKIWHEVVIVSAAVGLTGSGIGLIKYLKHMPAPYQDQPQLGGIFDTFQDLASNNDRIGERRTRTGLVIPAIPQEPIVPPPVPANPEKEELK